MLLNLSDDLSVTRLIEALDELGNLVHGLWWRKSGGIHEDQAADCRSVSQIMSRAEFDSAVLETSPESFWRCLSQYLLFRRVEVEFAM